MLNHSGRPFPRGAGRLWLKFFARPGRTAEEISITIHGTTLVTNTLIERKGAKTGLITTKGFRDVLEMGNEVRYELYDLSHGSTRALGAAPSALRGCAANDRRGEKSFWIWTWRKFGRLPGTSGSRGSFRWRFACSIRT